MATKRPKKKKTDKKKKVIEVTFDTPMSKFANPIIAMQQRDLFYQKLSTEQMNELLIQNGIVLDQKEIVPELINTTFQDTADRLCELYESKLDEMDEKNIILNSDLLMEYLNKLISQIDPCELADVDYLYNAFNLAKGLGGRLLLDYMLRIMKSVNRLKDHYPTRDIIEMCEPSMLDLQGELYEFYGIELYNTMLDENIANDDPVVVDLLNELEKVCNELIVESDLIGLFLEIKVSLKMVQDDSLLRQLCNQYPNHPIRFYLHHYIALHNIKVEEEICQKYYDDAMKLPILNEDEKQARSQFIMVYKDFHRH